MIKREIFKILKLEKMETTVSKLMGCWKAVLRGKVIEVNINSKKKRNLK